MEDISYREILKLEMKGLVRHERKVSLRMVAQHVKMSPSMISAVLKGKKHLSLESALKLTKYLKMNKAKAVYFTTLVQFETAKSEDVRDFYREKLELLKPRVQAQYLEAEMFQVIAEWYHLPILELSKMDDFILTAKKAAAALQITSEQAEQAIERLCRLNLLQAGSQKSFVKSDFQLLVSSNVPSEALRHYHRQMLGKAVDSLTQQLPQEKYVGSETFAFDMKNMAEVNALLEECFAKVTKLAGQSKNKKSVFHLGIQFFKLGPWKSEPLQR